MKCMEECTSLHVASCFDCTAAGRPSCFTGCKRTSQDACRADQALLLLKKEGELLKLQQDISKRIEECILEGLSSLHTLRCLKTASKERRCALQHNNMGVLCRADQALLLLKKEGSWSSCSRTSPSAWSSRFPTMQRVEQSASLHAGSNRRCAGRTRRCCCSRRRASW